MILDAWGTPGGVILEALGWFLGVLDHFGTQEGNMMVLGSILGPLETRKTYPKIEDFRSQILFLALFFDVNF